MGFRSRDGGGLVVDTLDIAGWYVVCGMDFGLLVLLLVVGGVVWLCWRCRRVQEHVGKWWLAISGEESDRLCDWTSVGMQTRLMEIYIGRSCLICTQISPRI
jgi:hypothetical protein